jgi:hypothetical protein
MSDPVAQRQALHTIKGLVDAALLVDVAAPSAVAAIVLECVKYIRASSKDGHYGLLAGEIQNCVSHWHNDHVDAKGQG